MLIAVFRDFDTPNQLHDKLRPAGVRRSGIEYFGDVTMVHQRQRLSFSLKTGNDAFSVHARFNNLQGYPTTDRFLLLRHENDAIAAFADLLQQLVPTHPVTRLFPSGGFNPPFAYHFWRLFQESSSPVIGPEQSLYSATQILVSSTSPVQKSGALRNGKLNRFREHFDVASGFTRHWIHRVRFHLGCSFSRSQRIITPDPNAVNSSD